MNRPQRVRLVLNPRSGHPPDTAKLAAGIDWLTRRGWQVERQVTSGPGDGQRLARLAAADGVAVLVACGGDGTINEVINGLAGSQTALAVLPSGSANVWAREAGVPRDPRRALQLLEHGRRRRIDLGRAGERYFLLMASVGLDSVAVQALSSRAKARFGRFGYAAAGVHDLIRSGDHRLNVTAGEECFCGPMFTAIIGNTRLYAGMFEVTRHARLDDHRLDLCLYRGEHRRDLPGHLLRTLRGRHDRHPQVVYRQAEQLQITAGRPLPVQADGDPIGFTPMSFSSVPEALTVILANRLPATLFSRDGAPSHPRPFSPSILGERRGATR